jgi:outer membrane protein OmpA-like peptidoglycan-associated protein
MAETAGDPDRRRSAPEPLVLALIGLAIAALLFAGSALPVLLSRGDDASASNQSATSAPASEPTVTDEANVAPATTTVPSGPPPVAESSATVRGGQLFLEGAVSDDAVRNEIVVLATEIFGADNVIDDYVVDARAGDANLGNVHVSDAVLFEWDSAVITPAFEPLLNQGLVLLRIRPDAQFVVEGHTDSLGSDAYNFVLSQERADAVVSWYTDRGVDASRLSSVGLGSTEPIATYLTSKGREMNSRIEVTIENLLSGSE